MTEGGTLDDNSRHAISKLSMFHLVTNEDSKRLINLGEENRRILNVGFLLYQILIKKIIF